MTQLIYVADPMCSWCYGFGPELQALLDSMPDAELDILVGGLRAYNKEPLSDELRQTLHQHWKHVTEASGLPFSEAAMGQPGFIYDTEPACRAFVAAKMVADHLTVRQLLPVFHAIQRAFYAQGADVTDLAQLAVIVTDALNQIDGAGSFDAESFLETLNSPACMMATQQEFQQCQRWDIRGFPTLLLLHQNALHMVASGYTKTASLQAAISQVKEA
ncbi:DsbA family protein [Undibacterium griseum]|uniref:DsbA family protein n=1 Tax=Undibacterium griseum TaxID=2762295 RepID=A0ABR6YNM2_9BURK|nr:DsbA family protein [Undibacterium griseum]MBC3885495.1 DsbA family protein [Undibacterium griseum]